MATAFNDKSITAGTGRTLLYSAPAATTSVMFSGTVSNKDTTTKAQYNITVERKVGATYTSILTDIPVQYGQSLKLPKVVLKATEELYITASAASVLDVDASILEMS